MKYKQTEKTKLKKLRWDSLQYVSKLQQYMASVIISTALRCFMNIAFPKPWMINTCPTLQIKLIMFN